MKNSGKNLIFFKYIIVLLCICCWSSNIEAKHIIGGDVFYQCIELDTIDNKVMLHFEFQMYRDNRCSSRGEQCAYFDGDGRGDGNNAGAEFGVYRSNGRTWSYVKKTSPIRPRSIQPVPANDPPCLIAPPAIEVERGVYEFDIELDIIESNYLITYQRCCRSESISNLQNPGNYGAVFSIEITPEALKTCNNSPIFNEFPPLIICAGFELEYDHGASDAEGDEVVYEFCTPLSAGGTDGMASTADCNSTPIPEPSACTPDRFRRVGFLAPSFTSLAPMGGDPVVTIDPNTGLVAGVPTIIGEHVMAVCANEYRDGVLLSTIRRDFQFIVSACEKAVNADIVSDQSDGTNYNIVSCGDFDVQFQNRSTRLQDIVSYSWEFEIDERIITSNQRDPKITFPAYGVYDAKMIVNEGIPNCTDSAFISVSILPGLEAEFTSSYDTCIAGPVTFREFAETEANNFIVSYEWDFDDGNADISRNPRHIYSVPGNYNVSLTVTDNNGCEDEYNQRLEYAPAPNLIIVEPSKFIGCEPAEVRFNNLTTPIDETYDIFWDFGDGSDGENRFDLSPTHTYEDGGVYSVKVDIISPLGCMASRNYPSWINVQAGPDADFDFTPNGTNLTINNSTVSFINSTVGAIDYYWEFGDGNVSFEQNPTHTYQDTGMHRAVLYATSSNGCMDSISMIVDVIPVATIQFPNAFTPNNDGDNDQFRGVGSVNLVNDYTLTIFDRWGKIVFESEEPTEGWNGQLNNSGAMLPPGVYMCYAEWRAPRGDREYYEGSATLIR